MDIQRLVYANTHGTPRHGIPLGIREMINRSNRSNCSSPWYGNSPGWPPRSIAYQEYAYKDEEYEDYGDHEDYGEE